MVSAIRQAVKQLDPDVPISNVRTEADYVSLNAAQPRLNAVLLAVFAMVALVIAARRRLRHPGLFGESAHT